MATIAERPGTATEPTATPEAETGKKASKHQVAEPSSWPWLPNQSKGVLQRHPWCPHCGQVKAVGAARALELGGIVNLLARLDRELQSQGYHKITEAQRRLIIRKLQKMEADDTFSFTRDRQFHLIAEVTAEYLHLPVDVIGSYLSVVARRV